MPSIATTVVSHRFALRAGAAVLMTMSRIVPHPALRFTAMALGLILTAAVAATDGGKGG